jgi:hypothetical protein
MDECVACQADPILYSSVTLTDDLPLCRKHWNWWLLRWLYSTDLPPCSAHLIDLQNANHNHEVMGG